MSSLSPRKTICSAKRSAEYAEPSEKTDRGLLADVRRRNWNLRNGSSNVSQILAPDRRTPLHSDQRRQKQKVLAHHCEYCYCRLPRQLPLLHLQPPNVRKKEERRKRPRIKFGNWRCCQLIEHRGEDETEDDQEEKHEYLYGEEREHPGEETRKNINSREELKIRKEERNDYRNKLDYSRQEREGRNGQREDRRDKRRDHEEERGDYEEEREDGKEQLKNTIIPPNHSKEFLSDRYQSVVDYNSQSTFLKRLTSKHSSSIIEDVDKNERLKRGSLEPSSKNTTDHRCYCEECGHQIEEYGRRIEECGSEKECVDLKQNDHADGDFSVKDFRDRFFFETHSTKSSEETPGHRCIHRFVLNERLVPEPVNADVYGTSRCVVCNRPMHSEKVIQKVALETKKDKKKGGAPKFQEYSHAPRKINIGAGDEIVQLKVPFALNDTSNFACPENVKILMKPPPSNTLALRFQKGVA